MAVLIDDWVIRVGRALARFAGIPSRHELTESTIADLDRDTRFGVRDGVAWVRHLLGNSTFLDRVPLTDDDIHTRFPVTEHLWLKATTACRLTTCDTTTMIRMGDPWAGLDDFHRATLDFLADIDRQANLVRWTEFQKSIAHEATLFESVSARLAAAANTATASFVEPSDDALIRACLAVGQYMGIEVRAPQQAGDESPNASRDPLGDVARASGFQVRPVTLAEEWWRRRGGDPLLGQLAGHEREPVALVPSRLGLGRFTPAYELHDSQGQVRPVSVAVARLVAPTAWVFYRTLPDNSLKQSDLVAFSMKLPALGASWRWSS